MYVDTSWTFFCPAHFLVLPCAWEDCKYKFRLWGRILELTVNSPKERKGWLPDAASRLLNVCHCITVKMKMFESLSMERIYRKEGEIPSKPQLPRDSVAIKVVVGCSTVHGPVSWVCSACSRQRGVVVQGGTSLHSSTFLGRAVEEGGDLSQVHAQQKDKRQQVHTCSKGGPCSGWECSGTSMSFLERMLSPTLKTFKSNWLWPRASYTSFELSPVITAYNEIKYSSYSVYKWHVNNGF